MRSATPIPTPAYPFDRGFYDRLRVASSSFELVHEHEVPANGSYGFRVAAGQAWRFVAVERETGLDVVVLNAEDPSETYSMSTQLSIEGLLIAPGTRIWGTPPRSRPLCTVLADTHDVDADGVRRPNHVAFGGHCNPHEWVEVVGWQHPRTCEDNLREACASLGLGYEIPGENLNLNQRAWINGQTGFVGWAESTGGDGDYLELYAEIPLYVAVSLCPSGNMSAGNEPDAAEQNSARWQISEDQYRQHRAPTFPCLVQIFETGTAPLAWPNPPVPSARPS